MADTFNVTAAYDKPSYAQGDTMTITISGDDVLTETVQKNSGNLSITIKAADGATATIKLPPAIVNVLVSTNESVVISGVTDDSGRTWTVASSGLTATAVA